jgi:hypothetical protein
VQRAGFIPTSTFRMSQAVNFTRHCERSEAIRSAPRFLDCFVAEPVIGPATSGRTRWLLAMTIGSAIAFLATTDAQARDFEMGGDDQYPYSIMAPEPGVVAHHRSAAPRSMHHKFYTARGSSGSVLPTPLPRTPLMPPEGSGAATLPALSQEQAPTILHGLARPIPNLPHGPETFQDRASRCAFQSGLYNVPGTLRTQYTGTCVQ